MSPWLSDLFLASQSDERLVALASAGHERAFAAIVERYRPELVRLARRLSGDGRAEDVVQQALMSAFSAIRSGTEVKHLRGWLFQILRHSAARARRPLEVPLDSALAEGETLEDLVQTRTLALAALSEVARLPERQRRALIGSAFAGQGRQELATSMGVSEGAIRQLVHRARIALRTAVTAVTPWPLARWFTAAGSSGPSTSELVASAGAATGGGVTLKLGALLATGVVASGVVVTDPPRAGHQHPAKPVAAGPRFQSSGSGGRAVTAVRFASLTSSALSVGGSLQSRGERMARSANPAGGAAQSPQAERSAHPSSPGSTQMPHDGTTVTDQRNGDGHGDGGRAHSGGREGGQGSGGHDASRSDAGAGGGQAEPVNSGSDGTPSRRESSGSDDSATAAPSGSPSSGSDKERSSGKDGSSGKDRGSDPSSATPAAASTASPDTASAASLSPRSRDSGLSRSDSSSPP